MPRIAPLMVTADNYAVGKLNTYCNTSLLLGFYQIIHGYYIRVKVHIRDGHSVAMEQEEIHQFPENHIFHTPAKKKQNGGNAARCS